MKINKFQNIEKTKKTTYTTMPKGEPTDKMLEFLDNFTNRAEFELSDVGYFREISEEYLNDNPLRYVGRVGLRLSPENTSTKCTERLLEAFVTDETGKYETAKLLKKGGREEILAYLKSKDAWDDLDNYITESSDRFFADENI